MKKIFRLGTRGSPLALVQARLVRDRLSVLRSESGFQPVDIEIVPLQTTGDWSPAQGERSFLELGQTKGLFTKEIEEALLDQRIDFAVHSMKDVSVWTPDGLSFAALLTREDPRDAFVSPVATSIDDLPRGARVGTSSLRRKAQLLMRRPDLDVVPFRGNVETRLAKLAAGDVAATLLAMAGLRRLGLQDKATSILEPEVMLPAPAQGVLGIEMRAEDHETRALVSVLHDPATAVAALAERAVLRELDGSCRAPVAALAVPEKDGLLRLTALAAQPDGSYSVSESRCAKVEEAEALGVSLGQSLRQQLPDDFLA